MLLAAFSTGMHSVTAVFPASTSVPGYCTNMGYTNWASALLMAAQWPWKGVPVPDIYVWFTDGACAWVVSWLRLRDR
jgi:hypothetical protein